QLWQNFAAFPLSAGVAFAAGLGLAGRAGCGLRARDAERPCRCPIYHAPPIRTSAPAIAASHHGLNPSPALVPVAAGAVACVSAGSVWDGAERTGASTV